MPLSPGFHWNEPCAAGAVPSVATFVPAAVYSSIVTLPATLWVCHLIVWPWSASQSS